MLAALTGNETVIQQGIQRLLVLAGLVVSLGQLGKQVVHLHGMAGQEGDLFSGLHIQLVHQGNRFKQ